MKRRYTTVALVCTLLATMFSMCCTPEKPAEVIFEKANLP